MDIENMQPYAKAYFKIVKPKRFEAYKYMAWIKEKHEEFREIYGLPDHIPYNDKQREKFIEFINIKDD